MWEEPTDEEMWGWEICRSNSQESGTGTCQTHSPTASLPPSLPWDGGEGDQKVLLLALLVVLRALNCSHHTPRTYILAIPLMIQMTG